MKQIHPRAVWLFFIRFVLILFFIFVFLGIYAIAILERFFGIDPEYLLSMIWIFFAAILAASYIWARWSYYYYRYELIENGFRKELGVIYKKYVTIPYERIQNVDIYRGIWARILGLSTLLIQTAGMSAGGGRYGWFAEGILPGLSRKDAEKIRDELIARARQPKNQGV
jgi:membrane protein YdbS with pleckstrin-like domain